MLQQLDAVARLAAIARRLIDPPRTPPAEAGSMAGLMAGVRGLEKALRMHARVTWALRLIDALRARLVAELQAPDSGRAPTPQAETRAVAVDLGRSAPSAALESADRIERVEAAERPERPERRERFGFERRHADKDIAEILQRPAAEIIALICRELGLPDDWPRLAEQAWAREQADDDRAEPPCPAVFQPSPGASCIAPAPS